jgi:hypothetical protein
VLILSTSSSSVAASSPVSRKVIKKKKSGKNLRQVQSSYVPPMSLSPAMHSLQQFLLSCSSSNITSISTRLHRPAWFHPTPGLVPNITTVRLTLRGVRPAELWTELNYQLML